MILSSDVLAFGSAGQTVPVTERTPDVDSSIEVLQIMRF